LFKESHSRQLKNRKNYLEGGNKRKVNPEKMKID